MAAFHLRSISLPSRSHPLTVSIELYKLKASQSSSIGHKLAVLKELYDCVDDFLQLPFTQQTFCHERLNQSVEEALNGSLRSLEVCSTTRDFLSQMRECVQGLESSIRRKRAGESDWNEVDVYMASRKRLTKAICKHLRNLKRREKNCRTATLDENFDLVNMINMLKGAEETSLAVFESILSFISHTKRKTELFGWSIVSKLLQPKNGDVEANEAEKIDGALLVLRSSKDIDQVQIVLKGLEALESSLQEAGEELDCVYRRLVKTRVTLLNILNH
ncbi:hypothetical protein P3X46_012515 [Hevea brasiliensis]|uniref:Uncharacterized protein n=1 Tax=Hevea brasiliensis TaxID=3981 RepID=A0ABQ9ME68_HEVBR|nr:uncharacterized protein LOC110633392 [Hevea brasiliensis]KAJ9177280.1 hypothetical protein P3X46_012515 [Hevea brasiliensis]